MSKGYNHKNNCKCMICISGLKGDIHPRTNLKKLKNNYNKITPEFCYVLGTVLTDGSLDAKQGQIYLGVIDEEFILKFKKYLKIWSGFDSKIRKEDKQFILECCSIVATKYLKSFNYTLVSKSNVKCKVFFLKAVFDAEGSVDDGWTGRGVTMSSSNYKFITFIKFLLKDLGIESNEIRVSVKAGLVTYIKGVKCVSNFDNYELRIGRKENMKLFNNLVKFTIKRKQDKLVHMLNKYGGKKEDW